MPINSHIQLNKAIMKRFSFKALDPDAKCPSKVPTVYYLDIKNKEIKTEKITKLGTSFGYFSDSEEKTLSVKEEEFGNIAKELEKWEQGSLYNLLTHEEEIKAFADLLLARSEMKQVLIRQIHNMIFREKYKSNKELLNKHPIVIKPISLFANHGVTLMINETKKNLVIPRNGFYFSSPDGRENCFVLPINPKRAIMLYPKSCDFFKSPDIGNPPLAVAYTNDESSIMRTNANALLTETIVDEAFVISKSKEELVELLEFMESDMWKQYEEIKQKEK